MAVFFFWVRFSVKEKGFASGVQLFHLRGTSSLLFNNLTHILVGLSPQEGSYKPERLPVQEASSHCGWSHLENMVVFSRPFHRVHSLTQGTPCSSSLQQALAAQYVKNCSREREVISIYLCGTVAAACFRLTSLIFRTCLCCVYSLSFPGHFGNSNLSLSLITLTTLSTSGLGLPECLICRAFYCSHIAGAVNACVAVYCLLLWRTRSIFFSDTEC